MSIHKIHVVKGRNETQTSRLLQTIHDSMVKAVEDLGQYCDIAPKDIMISCIENSDADWHFLPWGRTFNLK